MHIAQVLLSPRIGGAESLASSLAISWQEVGVTSETLYLDPTSNARSRRVRLRELREALRTSDADLALSHSALPSIYARLAAARAMPVVTVLHSASNDFASLQMSIAERLLRRRTAATVAVSESQARQYSKHFHAMPPPHVIPNGIRKDLPLKVTRRDRPSLVVTMARVAAQKDPQLWLDTAESPAVIDAGLELQWWGPVSSDAGVNSLVETHNLSGGPGEFKGPTSEPASTLLEADIFFHPSAREAHSVGLLEAAAIGLPIVCSHEVAKTTMQGIVSGTFNGPDQKTAAEALTDLVDHWSIANQDRAAVSAEVRERFGMDRCASSYLELFRTVLQHRRP